MSTKPAVHLQFFKLNFIKYLLQGGKITKIPQTTLGPYN